MHKLEASNPVIIPFKTTANPSFGFVIFLTCLKMAVNEDDDIGLNVFDFNRRLYILWRVWKRNVYISVKSVLFLNEI